MVTDSVAESEESEGFSSSDNGVGGVGNQGSHKNIE
jgi:hypothetical protein